MGLAAARRPLDQSTWLSSAWCASAPGPRPLSGEQKSVTGNTITVTFYQSGTLDMKPRHDWLSSRPDDWTASLSGLMKFVTTSPPAKLRLALYETRPQSRNIVLARLSPAEIEAICKKYGENSWECHDAKENGKNRVPDDFKG
jgi:hypothetical protein